MKNLFFEVDSITVDSITLEEIFRKNIPQLFREVKTFEEKQILTSRINSLNEITNNKFSTWSLQEKSNFLANYRFKHIGGSKGIWKKRQKSLDSNKIFKHLSESKLC